MAEEEVMGVLVQQDVFARLLGEEFSALRAGDGKAAIAPGPIKPAGSNRARERIDFARFGNEVDRQRILRLACGDPKAQPQQPVEALELGDLAAQVLLGHVRIDREIGAAAHVPIGQRGSAGQRQQGSQDELEE
jgi:hypothetical protein